jgi:LPXTG-motif cell wall-anchored protein
LPLILAWCLLTAVPALAADGDGDGSGGDSDEPLALTSSSVPDGASGVSADVVITLTFSKNVVNMSVRDNNIGCFSLADTSGSPVPISILMGDDQVDPSVKRIVQIAPVSDLRPGTAYTLVISGNLTSKSGVNLGQDLRIGFTTAGSAATPAPSAPAASARPTPMKTPAPVTPTPEPSPGAVPETPEPTAAPTAVPNPAATASVENTPTPGTALPAVTDTPADGTGGQTGEIKTAIIAILGAAVLGGAVALFVISRFKRKK